MILAASVTFTVGSVVMGFASDKEALLAGRIIVGIGIGKSLGHLPFRPHLRAGSLSTTTTKPRALLATLADVSCSRWEKRALSENDLSTWRSSHGQG